MLNHKTIITIGAIILLAIGFSSAGGKSDKDVVNNEQTTIQTIDTTKLEKYERKVIIKAKVGSGPGEIGVIGEGPMPEEEALWEGSMEGPKGIAVDSAGYIFILDALNKRILRFSPNGRYISAINLVGFDNRIIEGNLENRLFIGSEGNFFIKERMIKIEEKVKYIYSYDKTGKLLGNKGDMPVSVLNLGGKKVVSTICKYTEIKAIKDTVIYYYITDSIAKKNYTLRVDLPRRDGWEYMITPYSFLGVDKKENSYVSITMLESTSDLHPLKISKVTRKVETVVFKYNEDRKLAGIIAEQCADRGREMWTLGTNGALYLLKYSFKTVVTDELPEWLKDSAIPEEAKEYWRRRYTAPEGFVYVVKFTKVEEK